MTESFFVKLNDPTSHLKGPKKVFNTDLALICLDKYKSFQSSKSSSKSFRFLSFSVITVATEVEGIIPTSVIAAVTNEAGITSCTMSVRQISL